MINGLLSFPPGDVGFPVVATDGEFVLGFAVVGFIEDGEFVSGFEDVSFLEDDVAIVLGVDGELVGGFWDVIFSEGLVGVLGVCEVIGEDGADVVAAVVGVDGEIDFGVGDVGFFDDVIVGVLGAGGAAGECSVDGEIDFGAGDVLSFEGLVGLFRVKVVGECGADDKVPLDFGEVDFCVDGVVDVDGLDVELTLDFGDAFR
ncbi:hypothetical protein RB195_016009 [Necator americanus]|uniref:Uncharacterized protein n=1 Tax=Necator americanus TaxID=51031 RepID=A0ABR1E759_NECAM